VLDISLLEPKLIHVVEEIFEARVHEIPTVRRVLAEEHTERRLCLPVMLPVGLRHRQFIQVGEERVAESRITHRAI